jgi:general secretion pathway protein M
MIAALGEWWKGRSQREQILLGGMIGLLLLCVGWFGIWDPAQSARIEAQDRLEAATAARNGAAGQVAWLKANGKPSQGAPIADLVAQSANEVGFVLLRSQSVGGNRLTIEIASARAQALFGWLSALNSRGVFVETADIVTKSDATLGVTLTLRQVQ